MNTSLTILSKNEISNVYGGYNISLSGSEENSSKSQNVSNVGWGEMVFGVTFTASCFVVAAFISLIAYCAHEHILYRDKTNKNRDSGYTKI